MLRVIGGKHRSRKLNQPPLAITRPTMDRIKEAIFNMLQHRIVGSIVLDLFTGSGALGIEASSRGAMKVIAIDNSPVAGNVIAQNVADLQITNMAFVLSDAVAYVNSARGKQFDLIFIDPPFANFSIYNAVLKAITTTQILKRDGLIVFETRDPKQVKIPPGLVIQKERKYGISHVLLVANII